MAEVCQAQRCMLIWNAAFALQSHLAHRADSALHLPVMARARSGAVMAATLASAAAPWGWSSSRVVRQRVPRMLQPLAFTPTRNDTNTCMHACCCEHACTK